MSYAMREDYTLEYLSHGVHQRGVRLVELVEVTSIKYVDKDRSPGTGFINLWPVIISQLIDLWSAQQDRHNTGTRKASQRTNII